VELVETVRIEQKSDNASPADAPNVIEAKVAQDIAIEEVSPAPLPALNDAPAKTLLSDTSAVVLFPDPPAEARVLHAPRPLVSAKAAAPLILKRPPIKKYIVKAKVKPLPAARKPREIARSENWNRDRQKRNSLHNTGIH
jgi:hypothetical protein